MEDQLGIEKWLSWGTSLRRRGEGMRGRPAPGANVEVIGVGVDDDATFSMEEDAA